MHCWRYIKSCDHIITQAQGYSKTVCHVSCQVQDDIYTHVIWTTVYTSVYLYTGVLNCETVRETSSLLVCGKHTYLVLNNFLCMLHFRMVIEVVILLSVFDKQKFCYSIYCPLKVVDFFAELRNTTCKLSCSLWLYSIIYYCCVNV